MSEDVLEQNITEEDTENNFEKYTLITTMNEKIFYQCKICNFTSNLKGTLKKHYNKKNKCYLTNPFECNFCKKIFQNKTILKKHMEKQKKCYLTLNAKFEEKIENNKNLIIEKLESNEEKLQKQILLYEEDIKQFKDNILYYKELKEEQYKKYQETIADIHDTYLFLYLNKKMNIDFKLFENNFIFHEKNDKNIMEYKDFIINILDNCRNIETLNGILDNIKKYKKQDIFESLFKYYQKELELRVQNKDYKKIKYNSLELQLYKINTFITNNYCNNN